MSKFEELLENIPQEKKRLGRYLGDLLVSIQETMEKKGISQKELAATMGMEPPQLSRLLSDLRNYLGNPTLETIARLSTALNTELLSFPVFEEWSWMTFGDGMYTTLSDQPGERTRGTRYVSAPITSRQSGTVIKLKGETTVFLNAEDKGSNLREAA